MRLKTGRPDLRQYAELFSVPTARPHAELSVTFLGVSSLLVTDGTSSLMTDGFFSRPSLRRTLTAKLSPDRERIAAGLKHAHVERLDAVLPVHTHYDHAQDSAVVAESTGGVLIGGESSANIGRGQGLSDDQIQIVTPGSALEVGGFSVVHTESHHCPPDRYPGTIDAPLRPPVRVKEYRCGEAWSIHITHGPTGRRLLVQGSAGFVPGALADTEAEVIYLGVGQLGLQPERYIREYWNETVRAVGAQRVVLIHWDDFFEPADPPLRALPYAGDDLDATMRVFAEVAAHDQVDLAFPRVWTREDPWSGLT